MSKDNIEELKSKVDIAEVVDFFTPVSGSGKYLDALCIFHEDNSLGNFKINTLNQTCRCHVCMDRSIDVIEFLKMTGETFRSALDILKGKKGINGSKVNLSSLERTKIAVAEWKPVPMEEEKPIFFDFPIQYEYKNEFGQVEGYILRKVDKDGKKVIKPLTYVECVKEGFDNRKKGKGVGRYNKVGDKMWRFHSMNFSNRPLYNLEKLLTFTESTVLVVEGEKTCDAVNDIIKGDEYVVVTWSGGTNATQFTNFEWLRGRKLIFIPDIDYTHKHKDGSLKSFWEQPSQSAMLKIAKGLDLDNIDIVFPKNYKKFNCGDDLADFDWDWDEVLNFINENKLSLKI